MGLLELASGASLWRGYEYYQAKKVMDYRWRGETEITGHVSGNNPKPYDVCIHTDHPRKSSCTCPHAAGKRIICKHMVALYFTVFPKEADSYYREIIAEEEAAERREAEIEEALIEHISHMKKTELQQAILQILFDGPLWQYKKFILEYMGLELDFYAD